MSEQRQDQRIKNRDTGCEVVIPPAVVSSVPVRDQVPCDPPTPDILPEIFTAPNATPAPAPLVPSLALIPIGNDYTVKNCDQLKLTSVGFNNVNQAIIQANTITNNFSWYDVIPSLTDNQVILIEELYKTSDFEILKNLLISQANDRIRLLVDLTKLTNEQAEAANNLAVNIKNEVNTQATDLAIAQLVCGWYNEPQETECKNVLTNCVLNAGVITCDSTADISPGMVVFNLPISDAIHVSQVLTDKTFTLDGPVATVPSTLWVKEAVTNQEVTDLNLQDIEVNNPSLIAAKEIFSELSLDAANAEALVLAESLLNCTYGNEVQNATCLGIFPEEPPVSSSEEQSSKTISRYTFFSTENKVEANVLALETAINALECFWYNPAGSVACEVDKDTPPHASLIVGDVIYDNNNQQKEIFPRGSVLNRVSGNEVVIDPGIVKSDISYQDAVDVAKNIAKTFLRCEWGNDLVYAQCSTKFVDDPNKSGLLDENGQVYQYQVLPNFELSSPKFEIIPQFRGISFTNLTPSYAELNFITERASEKIPLKFVNGQLVVIRPLENDYETTNSNYYVIGIITAISDYANPDNVPRKNIQIQVIQIAGNLENAINASANDRWEITLSQGVAYLDNVFISNISKNEATQTAQTLVNSLLRCIYCNVQLNPKCLPLQLGINFGLNGNEPSNSVYDPPIEGSANYEFWNQFTWNLDSNGEKLPTSLNVVWGKRVFQEDGSFNVIPLLSSETPQKDNYGFYTPLYRGSTIINPKLINDSRFTWSNDCTLGVPGGIYCGEDVILAQEIANKDLPITFYKTAQDACTYCNSSYTANCVIPKGIITVKTKTANRVTVPANTFCVTDSPDSIPENFEEQDLPKFEFIDIKAISYNSTNGQVNYSFKFIAEGVLDNLCVGDKLVLFSKLAGAPTLSGGVTNGMVVAGYSVYSVDVTSINLIEKIFTGKVVFLKNKALSNELNVVFTCAISHSFNLINTVETGVILKLIVGSTTPTSYQDVSINSENANFEVTGLTHIYVPALSYKPLKIKNVISATSVECVWLNPPVEYQYVVTHTTTLPIHDAKIDLLQKEAEPTDIYSLTSPYLGTVVGGNFTSLFDKNGNYIEQAICRISAPGNFSFVEENVNIGDYLKINFQNYKIIKLRANDITLQEDEAIVSTVNKTALSADFKNISIVRKINNGSSNNTSAKNYANKLAQDFAQAILTCPDICNKGQNYYCESPNVDPNSQGSKINPVVLQDCLFTGDDAQKQADNLGKSLLNCYYTSPLVKNCCPNSPATHPNVVNIGDGTKPLTIGDYPNNSTKPNCDIYPAGIFTSTISAYDAAYKAVQLADRALTCLYGNDALAVQCPLNDKGQKAIEPPIKIAKNTFFASSKEQANAQAKASTSALSCSYPPIPPLVEDPDPNSPNNPNYKCPPNTIKNCSLNKEPNGQIRQKCKCEVLPIPIPSFPPRAGNKARSSPCEDQGGKAKKLNSHLELTKNSVKGDTQEEADLLAATVQKGFGADCWSCNEGLQYQCNTIPYEYPDSYGMRQTQSTTSINIDNYSKCYQVPTRAEATYLRFQEEIQDAVARKECCFSPNSTPYYCKDAGFDKPSYTSSPWIWAAISGDAAINKPDVNWFPDLHSFELSANAFNYKTGNNGAENTITSERNGMHPYKFCYPIYSEQKDVQAKLKQEVLVELVKICSYSIVVGNEGFTNLKFTGWKNCEKGRQVPPGTGSEDANPIQINRINTTDINSSPEKLVKDVLREIATSPLSCPPGPSNVEVPNQWQIKLSKNSTSQTEWSITSRSKFYNYKQGEVTCPQVNQRYHTVQLSDGMVWVLEATVDYASFSITSVKVETAETDPEKEVSGNSALINGLTGSQIIDYEYDSDDEFKQTKIRFVISGVYETTKEDDYSYADNTSAQTRYYKIYNNLSTSIGVDLGSYNGVVLFVI